MSAMPPEGTTEIAELAERVSALRQELETVEARLRGIGHGLPETVDVPTVLTTNPALRLQRRQSILMVTAAAGLLAVGILVGVLIGRPSPVAIAPAPIVTAQTTIAPPPTQAPPSREIPDPEPTPQPVVTAAPTVTAAPSPTPTVAEAKPSKGFLTITSMPGARVTDNDRVIGNTPLRNVEIMPGDHTLVIEGPNNERKTVRITVSAGESYVYRYTFGERVDRGF